jgi:hypothetical protein
MRLFPPSACFALLFLLVAGCTETGIGIGTVAHPNVVIVREFAAPLGVVTLDPSFGFSLHRGAPGVPPRQRGAAVARAAAFAVADSISDRLRAAGFDVVRSDSDQPQPGAQALIVVGAFRKIDEGYRRRVGAENSNIVADAAVEYATPGEPARPLLNIHTDSRDLPQAPGVSAAAARGSNGIEAEAKRVGAEIARQIIDAARRNNWPGAR